MGVPYFYSDISPDGLNALLGALEWTRVPAAQRMLLAAMGLATLKEGPYKAVAAILGISVEELRRRINAAISSARLQDS